MIIKSRVLVADHEEAIQTIDAILGDVVEICPAKTIKDAEECLEGALDMVICGIHFDGSNMFPFLEMVNRRYAHVPFIVFRDLPSALDPTFAQSVRISAKLLGALGLIDLYSLRQSLGTAEADRKFRGLVLNALNSGRLA